MTTTDTQARYRLVALLAFLGAGLMMLGYITADQWLALLAGLV